ncbi:hypothetical protein KY330_05510 [Candidatus Woesearchaeota archaeon]|nr:hypothetical protein [Candidatus Woesearchaeota archaeon]
MKRIMIVFLVVSLLLFGCGSDEEVSEESVGAAIDVVAESNDVLEEGWCVEGREWKLEGLDDGKAIVKKFLGELCHIEWKSDITDDEMDLFLDENGEGYYRVGDFQFEWND